MVILIVKDRSVKVPIIEGKNLLKLLQDHVNLISPCGGAGLCGKCKVIILEGREFLSQPTEREKMFLTKEELQQGYRLACQTSIISKMGRIVIEIPEESYGEEAKILESGLKITIVPNPLITRILIKNPRPIIERQKSDYDRILEQLENFIEMEKEAKIPLEVMRTLPEITREKEENLTITIFDRKEIIDISLGNLTDRNFGVAIDIGTTTVVAYLVNLNTAEELGSLSTLNPQIRFGGDIISRMDFAKKREQLELMRKIIRETVNNLIFRLCEKYKISSSDIMEICVVGNTAMHHLFLGISVINLVNPPYVPCTTRDVDIKAEQLEININKRGNIHVVGPLAGYVGSDVLADILVCGLHKSEEIEMLVDLGTNGEIALGNKDIIYVSSTAAGPAFEGVNISCGMMATSGAIDHVKIDSNGEVLYTVIGDTQPKGICGSGLIDVVAEMRKVGIINKRGRLKKKSKNVVVRDGELGFLIAKGEHRDIIISQRDIDELLLAKGAIRAGCEILMNKLGVQEDEISKVFLAGAFGSYVNKESILSIGMIPKVDRSKIFSIGNAAGAGAKAILLSKKFRDETEKIRKISKHIELMMEKDFNKIFASSMYL